MYLFFVHSYVASKIEKKEENVRESNDEIKEGFSNHWLMVRLNLSVDDIRNCKETTTFVKECKKIVECKKKGIPNLARKSIRKVSKT